MLRDSEGTAGLQAAGKLACGQLSLLGNKEVSRNLLVTGGIQEGSRNATAPWPHTPLYTFHLPLHPRNLHIARSVQATRTLYRKGSSRSMFIPVTYPLSIHDARDWESRCLGAAVLVP